MATHYLVLGPLNGVRNPTITALAKGIIKAAEAEFDSHMEMNPVTNMKDNKRSSSEVTHFRR